MLTINYQAREMLAKKSAISLAHVTHSIFPYKQHWIHEEKQRNTIYDYVRVVFSVGIACLYLTFSVQYVSVRIYWFVFPEAVALIAVSISYKLEDGDFRNSCLSFANFNKDNLFWLNNLNLITAQCKHK